MKNILTEELIIGKNVVVSETAVIRGVSGKAKRVEIGDNTYIGDNVQIIVDEFKIGDYSKVHHHTNFHGYKPLSIGHNAWIGQGTIVDSIGGTTIGNNCGIGAYSQLWSHIRYGDPLIGCNYEGSSPMVIGNDVWFVGHCIVSPIVAKDRSMALVGSVVTKDMEENHIYGGSPAKDLTDKIKPQFTDISLELKRKLIQQIPLPEGVEIIESWDEAVDLESISYFNIAERTYNKLQTDNEILFMKNLMSRLIKFVPYAS